MINFIHKIFTSRFLKIVVRIIASLASAIVVVSGYLFFINMQARHKDGELDADRNGKENESEGEKPEDP